MFKIAQILSLLSILFLMNSCSKDDESKITESESIPIFIVDVFSVSKVNTGAQMAFHVKYNELNCRVIDRIDVTDVSDDNNVVVEIEVYTKLDTDIECDGEMLFSRSRNYTFENAGVYTIKYNNKLTKQKIVVN